MFRAGNKIGRIKELSCARTEKFFSVRKTPPMDCSADEGSIDGVARSVLEI